MKKLTGKRKEKEAEEGKENFKNLLTKWKWASKIYKVAQKRGRTDWSLKIEQREKHETEK